MSRRLVRIGFVLNAVVLMAGVMVAVGGVVDDNSSSDTQLSTVNVASAARSTIGQSARLEYSMEMAGMPDMDEAVEFTGQGAFDGAVMEMTMDMSSILSSMEASMGETAPPEVAAMFNEPMRMVMDGPILYMCGGFIAETLGGGAECGQIDYRQFGDELGEMFGQQAFADQGSALGPLLGARGVEELGREEVRGVATDHVRGTYLMGAAMEEASPELREDMRRMYEQLGLPDDTLDQFLDLELDFEAWVDDEGLVRRIIQHFDGSFFEMMAGDVPRAGSFENARMTMSMELFDFGQPIDVQVPTDAADLMQVFAGS